MRMPLTVIKNHLEGDLKFKPSIQALNFLIIIGILLASILALSLYFDLIKIHQQYEDLATAVGRSISQQLIAVGRWNSQHEGVYVPMTEKFRLGPYREDLSREIATKDGRVLKKINPEDMTRLISEALNRESGIKIHITSLNLTNIANKADPWENEALKKFEKGSAEEFTRVGSDQSAVFRYMVPLRAEESCLNCHGKQGYKIGDIRGGLSVSFAYAPFQKAENTSRNQMYFVHLLFLLLGFTIMYFLGRKLIISIVKLQEALFHIKRLEEFLPICSNCMKIRMVGADEKKPESWIPFELYIQDKTGAKFSHGFCPECLKKLYNFEYEN